MRFAFSLKLTVAVSVVSVVSLFGLTGCPPRGGQAWDAPPRANRAQCDYAAKHVKGLKVGHPLDDGEQAQFVKMPEYDTFMQKCPTYSSESVQCLIDAPSLDVMQGCK